MIFMTLKTIEDAKKLSRICETYSDKMEVDVLTSRYTVDGASLLGVMSLLGLIVEIKPITDDYLLKTYFLREVEKIGAYEVIANG